MKQKIYFITFIALIFSSCSKIEMENIQIKNSKIITYNANDLGINMNMYKYKVDSLFNNETHGKSNEKAVNKNILPFNKNQYVEFLAYMDYCYSCKFDYVVCFIDRKTEMIINVTDKNIDTNSEISLDVNEFYDLLKREAVDIRVIKNVTSNLSNYNNAATKNSNTEQGVFNSAEFSKDLIAGVCEFRVYIFWERVYHSERDIYYGKIYQEGYMSNVFWFSDVNIKLGSYEQLMQGSSFEPDLNRGGKIKGGVGGMLTIEAGFAGFTAGTTYPCILEFEIPVLAPENEN